MAYHSIEIMIRRPPPQTPKKRWARQETGGGGGGCGPTAAKIGARLGS